ncbi:OmpA family protein [Rhizobium paknamense]|uniref:Outer membrane protein OmpA-like peptidoglycan-associated protein n=1 Tax=Rhizobium paknamense TaxID=1206817 RepID=A0ABU0I6P2_9HYPH|nr:OmpA family protein [Rhizobium paknamense]MDQ0453882.1 outer membrane protein OmpA-like peptidoglycan-associated protein [Rhizobium paknamense]
MAGQVKLTGPILVAMAAIATSSFPALANTSFATAMSSDAHATKLALASSTALPDGDGVDLMRVGGVVLAQAEEQVTPEELLKRRQKEKQGGQGEGEPQQRQKPQGEGEQRRPQREPQAEPQNAAPQQQKQKQRGEPAPAEPQQQQRPRGAPAEGMPPQQEKRRQPQAEGGQPSEPAQMRQQGERPAEPMPGADPAQMPPQKRQKPANAEAPQQPQPGEPTGQPRPEKPAAAPKAKPAEAPANAAEPPAAPQPKPQDQKKRPAAEPGAEPAPQGQQPQAAPVPGGEPQPQRQQPKNGQPQPANPAQPPVPGAAPEGQRPQNGQPQQPPKGEKPASQPTGEQPAMQQQREQPGARPGEQPQPNAVPGQAPGQQRPPLPPGAGQGANPNGQDANRPQQQGDNRNRQPGQPGQPGQPILPPLTATQGQPVQGAPGQPLPPGQPVKPGDPRRIEEAVTPRFSDQQQQLSPQEIQRLKRLADRPQDTDETIILPVDRGAPVLDSDKDNNWRRGLSDDQLRRLRREADRNYVVPQTDEQAQQEFWSERREDVRIERIDRFQGRRLDAPPRYDYPEDVRIERRFDDDRAVMDYGGQIVIRSDDNRRFAEYGRPPVYEDVGNGRVRVTVFKENGDRIVTLRNRYGQLIQRSRIDANGQDYVLFFSPDLYYANDSQPYVYRDPGASLPPMRLRVPLDQYIVDVASEPQRDYYDFFEQPPVEPVERVYTIDEVRNSARIRDKMRRVDLDTITFPTGSAEVTMNQAGTLKRIADGINKVLQKNPAETFMIEGHTDAVGSAESNLVLSDRRAEAVANILTQVYNIPPENMVTQGYGEQFLKVMTYGPSQENRRVTIRRITPLVRPVETSQQ